MKIFKCDRDTEGHGKMEKFVGKTSRIKSRGGRDEVWDRETIFSQLAKRSPRVVVSGKLQYFSHSKYF